MLAHTLCSFLVTSADKIFGALLPYRYDGFGCDLQYTHLPQDVIVIMDEFRRLIMEVTDMNHRDFNFFFMGSINKYTLDIMRLPVGPVKPSALYTAAAAAAAVVSSIKIHMR